MAEEQLTTTVSELKAKAGQVLRHVRESGIEVIITFHGEPYAKIVPLAHTAGRKKPARKTRRNAFPDLPPLTDADFEEIRKLWQTKLETSNNEYIPLREAAQMTGYTIDHLRRLIVAGKMGGKRIGRNYVTTLEDIKAYLATKPKPGPKGPRKRP